MEAEAIALGTSIHAGLPEAHDLRALVKGLPVIRQSGKPFNFILTRVRANLRNNEGAAIALDALGLVLPTRIHERVIYAETFAHGKTALEIDPKGIAAQEIAALRQAVRGKLSGEKDGIHESEKITVGRSL